MANAQTRPYPELSIPAIVLGTLQGVAMTAAFVYIALKLGFGLAGSTVAAILGFVALRGVLGRGDETVGTIHIATVDGHPARQDDRDVVKLSISITLMKVVEIEETEHSTCTLQFL